MFEQASFMKQLQQQSQDDVDFDIADLPCAGAGRDPTQLAGRESRLALGARNLRKERVAAGVDKQAPGGYVADIALERVSAAESRARRFRDGRPQALPRRSWQRSINEVADRA